MTTRPIVRLAEVRPLVLGSGSPRRKKLLAEAGVTFERVVPKVDETMLSDEDPYTYAERLAGLKAAEVSAQAEYASIVLGCDTIVVLDNRVLGKPGDEEEAFATLSHLVGKSHTVCTAVAFAEGGRVVASGSELTRVHFNQVTSTQIREYIATGEPMDKAGAYGIQGMGAFLVDYIEGNLDNVIGLPGKLLDDLAARVLSTISRD